MFRIKEVCLVVLHYIAGPSGIAIHLLIKEQKSIQVDTINAFLPGQLCVT